jgi:hypothetical protein
MSNWHIPPLLHHRRHARNGMCPASQFWAPLVSGANHLAEFGHRTVFTRAWELGVAQINTTSQTIARWRFRTGVGVDRVEVMLVLGASDANGVFIQPAVEVDLTISGGATTTLGPVIAPIIESTPTDAPDEWGVELLEGAVTENTVYECALRITGYPVTGSTSNEAARVLSALVYELGEPGNRYEPTERPIGGARIYDDLREYVLAGLSDMYRYNGGILVHWGLMDGAARTRTSATAVNLIDGSTTGTPTTAHQGWYIDPRFHRTMSRTTVQFQFACYASITGGATGTVRLIDTAGNTYGSISVTGATAAWHVSATINLPESAEVFLVPQFLSNGGVQTLSVYATSLIEVDL